MGDIWHSRINMVNFFYAEQVNISNGNFFSYRGELSKNLIFMFLAFPYSPFLDGLGGTTGPGSMLS